MTSKPSTERARTTDDTYDTVTHVDLDFAPTYVETREARSERTQIDAPLAVKGARSAPKPAQASQPMAQKVRPARPEIGFRSYSSARRDTPFFEAKTRTPKANSNPPSVSNATPPFPGPAESTHTARMETRPPRVSCTSSPPAFDSFGAFAQERVHTPQPFSPLFIETLEPPPSLFGPPPFSMVPSSRDSFTAFDTNDSSVPAARLEKPTVGRSVWAATLLLVGLIVGSIFGAQLTPKTSAVSVRASLATSVEPPPQAVPIVVPEPTSAANVRVAQAVPAVPVAALPVVEKKKKKSANSAPVVVAAPIASAQPLPPMRDLTKDADSTEAVRMLEASKRETANSL